MLFYLSFNRKKILFSYIFFFEPVVSYSASTSKNMFLETNVIVKNHSLMIRKISRETKTNFVFVFQFNFLFKQGKTWRCLFEEFIVFLINWNLQLLLFLYPKILFFGRFKFFYEKNFSRLFFFFDYAIHILIYIFQNYSQLLTTQFQDRYLRELLLL